VSVAAIAGGRYRVERVLGGGAMAKVVLAHDSELDRRVAIKLLDERVAADPSFRARFTREARLAAALSHPNIVTVFDAGQGDDGSPYIVMEYVDGWTLQQRLRDEGALEPAEVRRIALQVCSGLEHAHAHGMIHRDLKPGNLIERVDGTVKIADFGIARADHATELTEAGTILGTAAYLAPEQAEAGTVTPATDVYALGVALYELLTGRRPWQVESLSDLARRRFEPPPAFPAHVPADLEDAITRSLAYDPVARPASASEFASLLTPAEREPATVVLPRAEARRPAPVRPRRSPATLLALTLSALVLVLAGLGLAIARNGDGGDGAAERRQPTQAPSVEPVPDGATPAEDARNLSEWLRENSR